MATIFDESRLTELQNTGVCTGANVVEAIAQSQMRAAPYAALRQITCEFRDGVLVLRGRVPSYYMKQIAQNLVNCVEGVLEVRNQLDVAPLLGKPEGP